MSGSHIHAHDGLHPHDHTHPHGHSHSHPHSHGQAELAARAWRMDARVKLIAVIAMVVIAVSTPPAAFLATGCYFGVVLVLMRLARVSSRLAASRVGAVLPFVALIAMFLPFLPSRATEGVPGWTVVIGPLTISRGGALVFWGVIWKALFGTLSVTLLTWTTPFAKLLQALEELRAPAVLVMLASFTYRYAFVLADEVQRMRRARDARGWQGRWITQARTVGQMIGVFFLRSYERAERIHLAMLARGFEGRPTTLGASPLAAGEVTLGVLLLAGFAAARLGLR